MTSLLKMSLCFCCCWIQLFYAFTHLKHNYLFWRVPQQDYTKSFLINCFPLNQHKIKLEPTGKKEFGKVMLLITEKLLLKSVCCSFLCSHILLFTVTDLRVDFQQITVLSDGKTTAAAQWCQMCSCLRNWNLWLFNILALIVWLKLFIMKWPCVAFFPLFICASRLVGLVSDLSFSMRCLRRKATSSLWVSGPDTSSTSPPLSMSR